MPTDDSSAIQTNVVEKTTHFQRDCCCAAQPRPKATEAKETPVKDPSGLGKKTGSFEHVAAQFNIAIVISTFAPSVIIAYVSLLNDIASGSRKTLFNVGTFFALLALSVHLAVIMVASRIMGIAARAQDTGTNSDTDKTGSSTPPQGASTNTRDASTIKDTHYWFSVCSYLLLLATVFFLITVGIGMFIIFDYYVWAVAVFGWAMILAGAMHGLGFHQQSLVLHCLKQIIASINGFRERRSRTPGPTSQSGASHGALGQVAEP